MTRQQFYVITVALCVITAIRILLADNKEQIYSQMNPLITILLSYMVWCDWDLIPKSWWCKGEE
jgi:hypothetical protein